MRQAASIVVRRGQYLLLVQRARAPSPALWALPGGGVEAGETPREAALRELWEETGLTADTATFLMQVELKGEPAFELHIFEAEAVAGEPEARDDAAAVAWVRFDKATDLPLAPGMAELLAQLGKV